MKSMTGMGKATGVVLGTNIRLEVKSVNHRYCEVNLRAPSKFYVLEILLQQYIKKTISRGRVDLYINEEKTSQLSEMDLGAFQAYFKYLSHIKAELQLKDEITLPILISGANNWIQKEMDSDKAWNDFLPILDVALADMEKMRIREGQTLKKYIQERFITIRNIINNISEISTDIQKELDKKIKEKITEKLSEVGEVDPNRLQMEVIYYLDRMDISEELERLKSHMLQMDGFFHSDYAIGRKIDFLLQEFNREFNTIASKSQNSKAAHLVIEAKSELEKIREQIQNIE